MTLTTWERRGVTVVEGEKGKGLRRMCKTIRGKGFDCLQLETKDRGAGEPSMAKNYQVKDPDAARAVREITRKDLTSLAGLS